MQMAAWEVCWFDKLGNEIMDDVVSEVDPYDPEDLELLGEDTPEKRNERMKNLKENMKASTAYISYGEYPWDPVSLSSGISARAVWSATFPFTLQSAN